MTIIPQVMVTPSDKYWHLRLTKQLLRQLELFFRLPIVNQIPGLKNELGIDNIEFFDKLLQLKFGVVIELVAEPVPIDRWQMCIGQVDDVVSIVERGDDTHGIAHCVHCSAAICDNQIVKLERRVRRYYCSEIPTALISVIE